MGINLCKLDNKEMRTAKEKYVFWKSKYNQYHGLAYVIQMSLQRRKENTEF